MLRKTTCAVGGIAIACAAAFSISMLAQPQTRADLDLRWLHMPAKGDRLSGAPVSMDGHHILTFDLSTQNTTIVMRNPVPPRVESAIRTLRPTSVRTIPIQPVREVPNEETESKTERLPEGCEPAFSPVTTPAFAHISVRCDS
jgi:hypothetical protein